MTTENNETEHAIIVTFDSGAHAPPAIALAAALARARRQALHGLFIEDEDLLRVAKLPFSQEIHRLSGLGRDMTDLRLERAMARLREEFRRDLEQQALRDSLNWSYSSMRGSRRQLSHAASPAAEILVIAAPAPARTLPQRVLLLDGEHGGVLRALESILETHAGPVEVLLSNGSPSETLRQLVAAHPGKHLRVLGRLSVETLFSDPGLRPRLVLAPRGGASERLQTCLRLARCPVLLVA